jgi:hypothetical protein
MDMPVVDFAVKHMKSQGNMHVALKLHASGNLAFYSLAPSRSVACISPCTYDARIYGHISTPSII